MSRFFQVKAFVNHWLNVVDEHSIHSPFFFDFYEKVVKATDDPEISQPLEKLRNDLLQNETLLFVEDFGAGSRVMEGPRRAISDIAAISLSPAEYAQLYYRICRYFEATKIVELGTCLGLTTLYFSSVPESTVHTFEGSHSLANVALTNFEYLDKKNIHLIEGDINVTLPRFLQNDLVKIGLAFVDANHRYATTIQYFEWLMKRFNEKSVMVIDDIHYSEEMEKAWNELKKHDLVYGSIDLFRCGILLFEPALNRQHFVWDLK